MTTHIKKELDLAEVLRHFGELSDDNKEAFVKSPKVECVTTRSRYVEIIARHEEREAALLVLNGPSRLQHSTPENISIPDLRYDKSSTELAQAMASKDFPMGTDTITQNSSSRQFIPSPLRTMSPTNRTRGRGTSSGPAGFPTFKELLEMMSSDDERLRKCGSHSFEQAALALRIWGLRQEPARDSRLGYFTETNEICTPKLVGGPHDKRNIDKAPEDRPAKKARVVHGSAGKKKLCSERLHGLLSVV